MSSDTPAQVATAAQITDALPLHELTLIGLFSGPDSHTALLRNRSGKIARAAAGQTVFGLKVQAIDAQALHGTDARGRSITLQLPAS